MNAHKPFEVSEEELREMVRIEEEFGGDIGAGSPDRHALFCEMALIDYLIQSHSDVKVCDMKVRVTMDDVDAYIDTLKTVPTRTDGNTYHDPQNSGLSVSRNESSR